MTEAEIRKQVADTALAWMGAAQGDAVHKAIIDTYNGHKPLPRGYALAYTDSWCAATVSAVSIKLGLTDIMPVECSCTAMIALYKALGRWQEDESVTPGIGDVCFYCWEDTGSGDCTKDPDHVGIVVGVDGGTIKVMEGNKGTSHVVGIREVPINGRYLRGFGRPDYAGKATTTAPAEDKLTLEKAIQRKIGADEDGDIGKASLVDIATYVGADGCWPLTVKLYGCPFIVSKDILPFAPRAELSGWANAISGSFSSGTDPWSILVSEGAVLCGHACHEPTYGLPETVLYKLYSGTIGIRRVRTVSELPDGLRTAVGGMGLESLFDPDAEGFRICTAGGKTEDFRDPLRDTNHTILGVKRGYWYLGYCPSMTAKEVNTLAWTLGLDGAIMLDGGHVAAINGGESWARINTDQIQYYAIQAI